ncbi:MAG: NAD(P)/FAD-dependent oxidoreductase [Pirellulaceae bacterium]
MNDADAPKKRWLVVGGGMAGLTLALRLSQRNQTVSVCEQAPTFGGLTSACSLGDVVWDRFYHVTLLSDSHLRGLLSELGLEHELKWVTTKTGFYSGGKLHSMSNVWEFLNFPPLTLIEKLRLGGTIFYGSKLRDWRKLEQVPVADWLRRLSGRGTFEKIWLPLLRAKLGETYSKASAAFIWSYIARMYKARRSGMKTEMFGYVPGGYARILDRFTAVLSQQGIELRSNQPVASIRRHENAGVSVTFGNGQVEHFDNVISTIPSPIISQQCPELTPDEHQRHQAIEYIGVVCASMLLDHPISPYYVTNITDTWVPMTAVIEMSTIVDREELDGHSLVYLPKYLPDSDPGLHESDAEIEERFLSTLEQMYDHFSREHVRLSYRTGQVCHGAYRQSTTRKSCPPLFRRSPDSMHQWSRTSRRAI